MRMPMIVCMAVLVVMRVRVTKWLRGLPAGQVPVIAPVRMAVDVVSVPVALGGRRTAHRENGSAAGGSADFYAGVMISNCGGPAEPL